MADHRVAYLRWDVLGGWKRLGGAAAGQDHSLYPYAYGSNWRSFGAVVRPGSTLWIVAAPLYRERPRTAVYRLPPTLIARLVIDRVAGPNRPNARPVSPDDYRWVAHADRSRSRYLPINNAFYALTEARFVNSRGQERRIPSRPRGKFDPANPYAHLPMHMQSIARLAPGGERPLEALIDQIAAGRVIFLSYAHDERYRGAPDFPQRLLEELRRHGLAPWLDLESVPQPEGSDRYAAPLLRQILADGLRQAHLVIALTGPAYLREGRWTRVEWELAAELARAGSLRILQVRVGGVLMDSRLESIECEDVAVTAGRIAAWWESVPAG